MKTLLQLALALFIRLDLATLRRIWAAVERLVPGLEVANTDGVPMTGRQKSEYVVKLLRSMVPVSHTLAETQIIRLIVEIVLIDLRLRNGGQKPRPQGSGLTRRGGHVFGISVSARYPLPDAR